MYSILGVFGISNNQPNDDDYDDSSDDDDAGDGGGKVYVQFRAPRVLRDRPLLQLKYIFSSCFFSFVAIWTTCVTVVDRLRFSA